jgi:hypothetical protein
VKRSLLILIALLAAVGAIPGSALATGTTYPLIVIANGSGNQYDIHVSGRYATYTDDATGASAVKYFDFQTLTVGSVPPGAAAEDALADVYAGTLLFTRVSINGVRVNSYPPGGTPTEVAPTFPGHQQNAAIGGSTIVWQDGGGTSGTQLVVDANGSITQLTSDTAANKNPNVSPDGSTVAWEKCSAPGSCDIYAAVKAGNSWNISPVATTTANETSPDTNGTLVVYTSGPVGASTIHVHSLVNGTDQTVALPSGATWAAHPAISGNFVAFEAWDGAALYPQTDLWVYDTADRTLRRITNTAGSELLSDISASTSTGTTTVRLVWQVNEGDDNVYGSQFTKVVDTTPPTLSLPGAFSVPATSPAGAVVTYNATATDNVDPNPSVSCSAASGATFAIGNTTVSCTATDAAGNMASGSFSVHVKGAPEQIVDLANKTLQYLGLSALSAPLQTRLQSTSAALIAGNKTAACGALNLYIAVVQAASGKSLTAAQAADLTADAQLIRAVIGC